MLFFYESDKKKKLALAGNRGHEIPVLKSTQHGPLEHVLFFKFIFFKLIVLQLQLSSFSSHYSPLPYPPPSSTFNPPPPLCLCPCVLYICSLTLPLWFLFRQYKYFAFSGAYSELHPHACPLSHHKEVCPCPSTRLQAPPIPAKETIFPARYKLWTLLLLRKVNRNATENNIARINFNYFSWQCFPSPSKKSQ